MLLFSIKTCVDGVSELPPQNHQVLMCELAIEEEHNQDSANVRNNGTHFLFEASLVENETRQASKCLAGSHPLLPSTLQLGGFDG